MQQKLPCWPEIVTDGGRRFAAEWRRRNRKKENLNTSRRREPPTNNMTRNGNNTEHNLLETSILEAVGKLVRLTREIYLSQEQFDQRADLFCVSLSTARFLYFPLVLRTRSLSAVFCGFENYSWVFVYDFMRASHIFHLVQLTTSRMVVLTMC